MCARVNSGASSTSEQHAGGGRQDAYRVHLRPHVYQSLHCCCAEGGGGIHIVPVHHSLCMRVLQGLEDGGVGGGAGAGCLDIGQSNCQARISHCLVLKGAVEPGVVVREPGDDVLRTRGKTERGAGHGQGYRGAQGRGVIGAQGRATGAQRNATGRSAMLQGARQVRSAGQRCTHSVRQCNRPPVH